MIITVTLNPAIDRTIQIESLSKTDVNRVLNVRKDAAGKGINVARVINSLGIKPLVFGIAAGKNGAWIRNELDHLNITNHFHEVFGETRENIKVHVKETSDVIEFNEDGPVCNEADLGAILKILVEVVQKGDILVLSGSAPQGFPNNVYQTIIDHVKHLEPKVILDTSNLLLVEGLKSKPDIIKPNRHELEALFNRSYRSFEEMIADAQTLTKTGIKEVVVSLGKKGSIYVSDTEVYHIKGITVEAKSIIGAGDAFVGGLAYGLHMGYDTVARLSYATAVATASVLTKGTIPGAIADVLRFLECVEIEKIVL